MLGVSIARNPKLANVFYRLHLIEAYGTGILKINESYSDKSVKPKIEVSSHAFKVTLPNANFERQQELYKRNLEERLMAVREPFTREQQIDSLFARKQFVSRKDVEDSLSTSQANAVLILRKMLEEGKINKVGSGKNVRYIIRH